MKDLRKTLSENLYDEYTRQQGILYESLLKSYSPEKLISTLEKKFGKNIIQYTRIHPNEYDKLDVAAFVCTQENEDLLRNNKEFQSVLNLFNYTFSYSYKIERNGHPLKMCVLEPNITGDYTSIVYGEWSGVVYHVTLRRHLESILKNGLRPKTSIYRKYDERVFLTGGENLERNLSILIYDLGYRDKDYVVLKIDLNKNPHKIKIFRDPMQTDCLGLYTRENISEKCIEEYPFEGTI